MFNKLFTKILDSSIWLEATETRIVWITLLAAMDQDGYAHFSAVENLASRARVSVEATAKAIECLMAPDPSSGNPDHEGRRIERVPGGFIILNAAYHRDMMNRVIQREKTRVRVAEWREKQKPSGRGQRRKEIYSPGSRVLLHYLNEKTGCHFREAESSLGPINARLKEKDVTIEGCKKMIDHQIALWRGDSRMERFLRPSTLFRPEKFNEYYAAKDLPLKPERPGSRERSENLSLKTI